MDKNVLTQESARACYDDYLPIVERGGSESELFTVYGFNLKTVVEPVIAEVRRLVNELKSKPLIEVESELLDPGRLKADFNIPDWSPDEL